MGSFVLDGPVVVLGARLKLCEIMSTQVFPSNLSHRINCLDPLRLAEDEVDSKAARRQRRPLLSEPEEPER